MHREMANVDERFVLLFSAQPIVNALRVCSRRRPGYGYGPFLRVDGMLVRLSSFTGRF